MDSGLGGGITGGGWREDGGRVDSGEDRATMDEAEGDRSRITAVSPPQFQNLHNWQLPASRPIPAACPSVTPFHRPLTWRDELPSPSLAR